MKTLRYFATEQRNPPKLDSYQGRDCVAACVQALTQLPTIINAAAMKRSVNSSLSTVLGISASHVGKGGLATLKPKKQAKVLANAVAYGKAQALKNGWSAQEFQATQDSVPRLANGNAATWASWLHFIQNTQSGPLPLNISLALERDELIDVLLQAVIDDSPSAFRDAVLEAIFEDVTEDSSNVDYELISVWARAANWDDIATHFVHLAQVLIVSLIAAIDVEWGGRYFQSFEPQPIFLWVAPRLNPNLSEDGRASKRNPVFRPTRRLLELSHAVAEFAYLGVWSKGPAGRSAIGAAMKLEDYVVGNLFDGTRKIGFEEFQSCWLTMCGQPEWQRKRKRKRKGFMHVPTTLAYFAIGMEAIFVETGPRMRFLSALLVDEADYRGRWNYFKERWKHQLQESKDGEKATEQWPEWLRSQSILSPRPTA